MSTSSPRLFSSAARVGERTDSPAQPTRTLFMNSANTNGDVATAPTHISPASSPRGNKARLDALSARRHSKELAQPPSANTAAAAITTQPKEPFVLKSDTAAMDTSEKSEDGGTAVLGVGKVEGVGPVLITATQPSPEAPPDLTRYSSLGQALSGSPRGISPATRGSSSGTDAGSPAIARQALLQHSSFHPGTTLSAGSSSSITSEKDDIVSRTQQPPSASSQGQSPAPPLSPKGTTAVIPPVVAEPEKLAPPPKQLDAPLDTIMPDEEMVASKEMARQVEGVPSSAPGSSGTTGTEAQPLHALEHWERIRADLQGKQPVIFLDYDGTLTPIVSEPSKAIITEGQRARLARLAAKYPVSIVTGRKIETIQKFLLGAADQPKEQLKGLENLYFAGSHGFDIRLPHGGQSKQVAEEYVPALQDFRRRAAEGCAGIQGALVEDNTYSISVHYRNVAPELHARIDEIVTAVLAPHEKQLQRFHGKCVHEIRPRIDWHKGAAVRYLLGIIYPSLALPPAGAIAEDMDMHRQGQVQHAPLKTPEGREIVPVYLGDDTTDEDAFRLLRTYDGPNRHALTCFVRADDKARPSAANYVLRNPDEVGALLEKLAEL